MNERIRELAEQAMVTNNRGDGYYNRILDPEKFAELIVRECISIVETYQIPVGNSAAGEMASEWTYDALKEIRDDIKAHFGVES